MKRRYLTLFRHNTVVQIILVIAIIVAIFIAGSAPYALAP